MRGGPGFFVSGPSSFLSLAYSTFCSAVTYMGSQPWPFPSSLMLGFTARARADSPEPSADGAELADVRWFSREGLTEQIVSGDVRIPPGISIARRLGEHWYGGDLPSGPDRDW